MFHSVIAHLVKFKNSTHCLLLLNYGAELKLVISIVFWDDNKQLGFQLFVYYEKYISDFEKFYCKLLTSNPTGNMTSMQRWNDVTSDDPDVG